jgi:two-component system OmpR family response regulator/two-component system alkaline phosphatase synthesis response regulator PhoP
MARLLVIEDDGAARRALEATLHAAGFEVASAVCAADGRHAALRRDTACIILDLLLPDANGIDFCRRLRNDGCTAPILILSGVAEELDKVLAFEAGADDYLTKPFGVRELVARARALMRRPRQPDGSRAEAPGGGVVRIHGFDIDTPKRRVRVGGADVELTDQEFRLLHLLATHAGIVFSREALLGKIWRGDTYVTVRSVDTLVKRLRHKIEADSADPRFVLTVWGVGYKLADV